LGNFKQQIMARTADKQPLHYALYYDNPRQKAAKNLTARNVQAKARWAISSSKSWCAQQTSSLFIMHCTMTTSDRKQHAKSRQKHVGQYQAANHGAHSRRAAFS
jgi:hypothetical protein